MNFIQSLLTIWDKDEDWSSDKMRRCFRAERIREPVIAWPHCGQPAENRYMERSDAVLARFIPPEGMIGWKEGNSAVLSPVPRDKKPSGIEQCHH